MARPYRVSPAFLAASWVDAVRAKLYSYYRFYEASGAAVDQKGVNNLAQQGSCGVVSGGGRVTSDPSNYFKGSAIDINTVVAACGWFQRQEAGGLTVPFSNRVAAGQIVLINGGSSLGSYVMTPGQQNITNNTDSSVDTWRFFYWDVTVATKTIRVSLDGGAFQSGNYTGTLNALGNALQIGGDQDVVYTTTWNRNYGFFTSKLTNAQIAKIYAAGSAFHVL